MRQKLRTLINNLDYDKHLCIKLYTPTRIQTGILHEPIDVGIPDRSGHVTHHKIRYDHDNQKPLLEAKGELSVVKYGTNQSDLKRLRKGDTIELYTKEQINNVEQSQNPLPGATYFGKDHPSVGVTNPYYQLFFNTASYTGKPKPRSMNDLTAPTNPYDLNDKLPGFQRNRPPKDLPGLN
jgi:hypothetical protein